MKLCNAELVKISKYHKTYLGWKSHVPCFEIVLKKCDVYIVFEVVGELRNAVKYNTDRYMLLYLETVKEIDGISAPGTFSSLMDGYILVDKKTGDICAGVIFRDELSEFLNKLFRELGV